MIIDGPTVVFIFMSLLKCGAVVGVMLGLVAYSVVAERRYSAWFQDRIGPNRVGLPLGGMTIGGFRVPLLRLFGLFQPVADGLKFLLKEEITPGHVTKPYFYMAPVLAMVPALLTAAVVPFGSVINLEPIARWVSNAFSLSLDAATLAAFNSPAVIADLNIGVLFVFAIVSISVYGIVIAGWSSNSKYPFLGSIRSSAQMISYEIAMGLSVVPVFLVIGNLNLQEIIAYQSQHGWLALAFIAQPSNWTLESFMLWPFLALSFVIFLVAAFAETNRLPFDLPECETELIGGYHTEYGAFKFALFFLGEYAAMLVTSCIMVTLFFGGWALPLPWFNGLAIPADWHFLGGLAGQAAPTWFWLVHIGVFLSKMAFFIFFFIWVRWTFPRFRYDQLMDLGWKFFIPVALANVVIVAFIVAYFQLNKA
ncbi:MAG: complex I subunit 1 family protein [Blastochloris sp.]|mgnify:CR=1 FL=1|nr:complex I subunit 1 family protein [Blastochloris sp.]